MNAADRLWDSVKESLYITREQFDQSLIGYTLTPMFNEHGMYGVVINKGPSFHFATFDVPWTLNREILKQWPGSLIEQYGYAETFTPIEDTRQNRFNRKLGFVETHRDTQYIHYRIERMKT